LQSSHLLVAQILQKRMKQFLKFIKSIETKSKDQEAKVAVRIVGSMLIALSGLILFSDKVLTFELDNNYGFDDTPTFIWVFSQSLSPFLILLGSLFKPFKTSYFIPVYIYSIQIYWVFQPDIQLDNALLQTYAIGSVFGFVMLSYMVYRVNNIKSRRDKENEIFKEETKEVVQILMKKVMKKEIV